MEFVTALLQSAKETSASEWMAVATSIGYIILMSLGNRIAWLFGIVSSGIYILIFYSNLLYLEAILQSFYVLMGIYGWYNWTHTQKKDSIFVAIKWHPKYHVVILITGLLITGMLGWLFSQNTSQLNPYADAMIFTFSIFSTFMAVKKVLENWIYWMAIDCIGIWLFSSNGLHLTAVLYAVYSVMAIAGFFKWRQFLNAKR
jgi:nicotinamide mononucleotide transporter